MQFNSMYISMSESVSPEVRAGHDVVRRHPHNDVYAYLRKLYRSHSAKYRADALSLHPAPLSFSFVLIR